MRILIITESYPPDVGGVAASASRLSRALAHSGERVHVVHVTGDVPSGEVQTEAEAGVVVHRMGRIEQLDAQLQMLGNVLTRLHDDAGFDLLHGFYLTYAGYIAAFHARLFGCRCCVSVRGNDLDRDMFLATRLPMILFTLQRADAVTCVSTELVRKVAALSDRDDAVFVPNGVEADVFQPVEPPPELLQQHGIANAGAVVGFVGELRFKKGFPFILDAFAKARADAHLLFVGPIRRGEKDYLADFLDLHAELKDRVHVAGAVEDRGTLAQLYCAMDVVLCPSLWDGMPNSVLEAMACGRVVLASDAGGIRDVIRSGNTGLTISRHELQRLGEAIEEALSLPAAERVAMGERARRRVLAEHTPEKEVEAYRGIYRALVSR